ncbi:HD domain-containing phosphohydrolase [Desulfobulbus alkaliphilus]|uniref:HD domain-containing phosphohydrolase n=1 Tax=Desulfobulbus alkaliphilus TaxID=869814 RepID=UPI001963E240|nr:HD domain-containing phosphohydrolase [Desulfobulbus alkaliphilus]MBM9538379.1 HD domain-containing protein [Desulfobulbus alkaliphilus]
MAAFDHFEAESRQLHQRRVSIMLLVSMGVMFLFTLLDYLLVPEHFSQFFRYRLFAFGCTGLLLVANYRDHDQRRAWVIGFAGYLCIGTVMLLVIHQLGPASSPYYVGLIVVITMYTALIPLTAGQALFSGLSLVSLYLLVVIFTETLDQFQLINLFSHLFFMICFVVIAAIQSWADTTARKHEHLLRSKQQAVASALARQAEHLESEVQRRAEALKASENKYRLLYEAIADDVVLVTRQGDILQANTSYWRHFHDTHFPPRSSSFFDTVRPEDREQVQAALLDVVARGNTVSSWQWTLVSAAGTPVEVEISGALLARTGKAPILQLLLRDISIRRRLENTLITSLQRCRKMENAAILALAKLSEYRDVTPGHHLERIREYCRLIAVELSRHDQFRSLISPEFLQNLYQGSILHDIGKVGVTDAILGKATPLTADEKERLRQHTRIGGDMIKAMEQEARGSSFLSIAKNIAYYHHERWDGSGYPHGLCGEEIPLEARIMAVADSYEAYTAAMDAARNLSHQEAVERIEACAGRHFDPAVVAAFVRRRMDFDWIRGNLLERVP